MPDLYGGARHLLLPENATEPTIKPVGLIVHSAASTARSLYDFFLNSSDLESHFYGRCDGVVEQYMYLDRCADANRKANVFTLGGKRYGFISWETQNQSRDHDRDVWTPAQVDDIVDFFDWGVAVYGWPRQLCPDPYTGGIGYHTLFGAPSDWTPVAKTCPGVRRVEQFMDEVLPRCLEEKSSDPGPGGLLMHLTEAEERELLAKTRENHMRLVELQRELPGVYDDDGKSRQDRHVAAVDRIEAAVKRIETEVCA